MESPRPTRKQPVSVDDMMDRLKSRPSSGGSRVVSVTTVDGEEREVRKKRKRRSHQPKKAREARVNLLRRGILFGLLPLVLVVIAGWYVMVFRYKGETFRAELSERVSEVIGLKTEVALLDREGFSVGARRILIEGAPGSILKEIELMDNKASLGLGSHFSDDWNIRSLAAQTCRIQLQETGEGVALFNGSAPGMPLALAGLGLNSKPGNFNVQFMRIGECNVIWNPEDEDLEPHKLVSNALLTASDLGEETHFTVTSGRVSLPEWPEMDIEHGKLLVSKSGIKVDEIRMERESGGDLEGIVKGSGTIGFGPRTATSMNFDFKNLDVRDFLPDYWQDIVIGKVTGSLRFTSELGRTGSTMGEGNFSMPGGVLGNLPSMKQLSTQAGDVNLARIVFDNNLNGKIRISPEGVEIYDIEGKSPGLFEIRGNVNFMATGRVAGEVKIGISDEILRARKGGKPDFFGPRDDEISWTTVILSGKRDALRDDLAPRFEQMDAAFDRQERENATRLVDPTEQGATVSPQAPPLDESQNKSLENAFDKLIGE